MRGSGNEKKHGCRKPGSHDQDKQQEPVDLALYAIY